MGGRSLKWWEIGFSMFSANAGPMMLIGFSSMGFSNGMVGSNFEWLAWLFLLLLSMYFLPYYITMKISTLPQFLQHRFGQRSYNFLVIYSLISILLIWLGSALYAGGLLLSQIFGCSLLKAIIVIAVITTTVTAIGGIKAIVRISVFQSIIIIASSIILAFLGLKKIGGISNLIHAVPHNYWTLFRPASDPEYSWVAIILGYPIVGIYYWCADQTIVQKVLAAKNITEGQYGSIFIAVLKIIMPFIFILPGIMCYVLFRNTAQPDNAYITLVKNLMPHGLLGLAVSALIAALIDTISSGLNAFSTVFTLDVASQFVAMNERQKRQTGKLVTVIAAGLSIILANLFAHSGKGFFEVSQGLVSTLAPPISVVFVFGILWKRVTSTSAEVVLYLGGMACILISICNILNYPHKGFWPPFLLLSFYIFAALSFVVVLITLLSKADDQTANTLLSETSTTIQQQRQRVWIGWSVLAVIMLIIYIIFN